MDKEKFEKDLETLFGPQKHPIYIFDRDNEDEVEEFRERYKYIKSLSEDERRIGDKEFLEAFKEEFDEEFQEAREALEKEFNERQKKASLKRQRDKDENSQTNCQNTSVYFVKEDNKEQIKEIIEIYEAIVSLPEDLRKLGDKEFLEEFKELVERWKTTLNSLKETEEIRNIKPVPNEMLFDLSTKLPKKQVDLLNKEICKVLNNITKEMQALPPSGHINLYIMDVNMSYSDIRRAKGICEYLGMECKVENAYPDSADPMKRGMFDLALNNCDSFNKRLLAKKLYYLQVNKKDTDYEEIGKIFYEEMNREVSLKQNNIFPMTDIPDGVELFIGAIICGLLGLNYLKIDNENLEYAPWSGIEIIGEDSDDLLTKVKNIYSRLPDISKEDIIADPEAFEHILANAKAACGYVAEDPEDEDTDDPHKWDGLNTYMDRILSSEIYLYDHLRKMIVKEVRTNQQSLDEYGDSYMFDERAFIKKYFEITDEDKLDRTLDEEKLTHKVIDFILNKLEKIKRGEDG